MYMYVCICKFSLQICIKINIAWRSIVQIMFVTSKECLEDILTEANPNLLFNGTSRFALAIMFFLAMVIYLHPPNSKVKFSYLWKWWHWSSIMPPLGFSQEDAHIRAARLVSCMHFFGIGYFNGRRHQLTLGCFGAGRHQVTQECFSARRHQVHTHSFSV